MAPTAVLYWDVVKTQLLRESLCADSQTACWSTTRCQHSREVVS